MKGLLIVCLLLFSLHLYSTIFWKYDTELPFIIIIKLNAQQIKQDDFLELDAIFDYPSSYSLDINSIIDQIIWSANPFAVQFSLITSQISEISTFEGQSHLHLHITLLPLKTGVLTCSLLEIIFQLVGDMHHSKKIFTPIFNIEVQPSDNTTLSYATLLPLQKQFPIQITDINRQLITDNQVRLQLETERTNQLIKRHAFPWVIALILFGIASIGWVAYLMRGYWRKRPQKPIRQINLQQEALFHWNTLEKIEPNTPAASKKYIIDLATILFNLLTEYTGTPAQQLTLIALDHNLGRLDIIPSKLRENIITFLAAVEEVKFAKREPTIDVIKMGKNHIKALFTLKQNDILNRLTTKL